MLGGKVIKITQGESAVINPFELEPDTKGNKQFLNILDKVAEIRALLATICRNYQGRTLNVAEITKTFANQFGSEVFIYIKVYDKLLGWDIDNKYIKPIADALIMSNVIQDNNMTKMFYCAKLEHLQILFDNTDNNFKSILKSNVITKKGDIFVHNIRTIDNNMLIALDILCKYKKMNRVSKYCVAYTPIQITFLSNENLKYHIIVANEENKKAIIKKINTYSLFLPKADKFILVFPDDKEIENIECEIPFLYCIYPQYEIIN